MSQTSSSSSMSLEEELILGRPGGGGDVTGTGDCGCGGSDTLGAEGVVGPFGIAGSETLRMLEKEGALGKEDSMEGKSVSRFLLIEERSSPPVAAGELTPRADRRAAIRAVRSGLINSSFCMLRSRASPASRADLERSKMSLPSSICWSLQSSANLNLLTLKQAIIRSPKLKRVIRQKARRSTGMPLLRNEAKEE